MVGIPQIPVNFIVGDMGNLDQIESVKQIQRLERNEINRYLQGYGVEHDGRAPIITLKGLLRDSLGFSSVQDVRFLFTANAHDVIE